MVYAAASITETKTTTKNRVAAIFTYRVRLNTEFVASSTYNVPLAGSKTRQVIGLPGTLKPLKVTLILCFPGTALALVHKSRLYSFSLFI